MGQIFGTRFGLSSSALANNFTIATTGSVVISAANSFVTGGNGAATGTIALTAVSPGTSNPIPANPAKPWRFLGLLQSVGGAALGNKVVLIDNNSSWLFQFSRIAAGTVQAKFVDASGNVEFNTNLLYNNGEWINWELTFDGTNTNFYCDHSTGVQPTLGIRKLLNSVVAQTIHSPGGNISMTLDCNSASTATNQTSIGPFAFYGSAQ